MMDLLIVGSDGLWDVVSPEQAAKIVRQCCVEQSSRLVKFGSVKRDEHQRRIVLAAEKLVVRTPHFFFFFKLCVRETFKTNNVFCLIPGIRARTEN